MLAIAVVLTGLLIAVPDSHGYHRDELYFLACAQHLAWGFSDQPPLDRPADGRSGAGVTACAAAAVGLAGAGLVVLTGLLVRERGGTGAAQALASAYDPGRV